MASQLSAEIVTLQFGDFANFVGAHYWNIEDELADLQATQQVVSEQSAPSSLAKFLNLQDEAVVVANANSQHVESKSRNKSSHTTSEASKRDWSEVDHKVSFRYIEKPQEKRVMRVPRLVSVGLSGSLGSISQLGTFHPDVLPYQLLTADHKVMKEQLGLPATWGGKVKLNVTSAVTRHPFQERLQQDDEEERMAAIASLQTPAPSAASVATFGQHSSDNSFDGSTVRYWTDFFKCHLHPKNTYLLSGIHHQVNPFDYYTQGLEYAQRHEECMENISDQIRYFTEECDHFQGFQCFVDSNSGFAGIATKILEELQDEYGHNSSIITFGVSPHSVHSPTALMSASAVGNFYKKKSVNEALSLSALRNISSIYVPLNCQDWQHQTTLRGRLRPEAADLTKPFYSSSILGAAIHTATTPYRCPQKNVSLHNFVRTLAVREQLNVMGLGSVYPLGNPLVSLLEQEFSPLRDQLVRTDEALLASKAQRKIPLYQSPSISQFSPLTSSASSLSETGPDVLYSEWAVMRGSKLCETPALTQFLKSQSSIPTTSTPTTTAANDPLDMGARLWLPFLNYLQVAPAYARQATYLEEPMPVPLPFPQYFFSESKSDVTEIPIVTDLYAAKSFSVKFGVAGRLFKGNADAYVLGEFEKAGMENTDWSSYGEALKGLAQEYEDDHSV